MTPSLIQRRVVTDRMVHFYHEISTDELYVICTSELGDVETIAGSYRRWVAAHPERIDPSI